MNQMASPRAQSARGTVLPVHQGDCLISADEDVTFSTVLGSCISACVRDPVHRIGGTNHFLLAEQSGSAEQIYGASARYGAHAMEQLINTILSQGGGKKSDLEIKVFGGGLINSNMTDIGANNVAFVRQFLANEGYAVLAEDLGGAFARRILYQPSTGRAFVKRLASQEGVNVVRQELEIAKTAAKEPVHKDDIELF